MITLKSYALAVGILSVAGVANAGGLTAPVIEPAPIAPVVVAPVKAFEGGYVGANLNYGQGKLKADGDLRNELEGFGKTFGKPSGASVAIRGGYDWQLDNNVVLGLGAEYNLAHYKKNSLNGIWGTAFPDSSIKVKNAATVFARAGYVFENQWLVYGLLGYSSAKGETSGSFGNESRNLKGFTYGFGTEYAIDQNWSAYGEYAFTDYGKVKHTNGDYKAELQQLKVGVNYRF